MIRQVRTNATLPFKNQLLQSNQVIFATDYDLGRNGEAYYDNDTADYHVATGKNTPGNKGRIYRNDGVDIDTCTDVTTNGYKVTSIQPGEWLQYTLTAPANEKFKVNFRYNSVAPAAAFSIIVNGKGLPQTVSHTSIDTSWKTVELGEVSLNKGINKIRVVGTSGEFNLNYIQFNSTKKASINRERKGLAIR
jgi:hypothetical protein